MRRFSLWIICFFLLCLLPSCKNKELEIDQLYTEENVKIDGHKYDLVSYCLNRHGNIKILKLKTSEDELIVPAQIEGYPVAILGGGETEEGECSAWLTDSTQVLDKIVVPEGVKLILEAAFKEVAAKEVILPSSLEKLGNRSFKNANITEVLIKGRKTILGAGAFENSTLEKVEFPNGFSGEIERECFKGSNIETFHWPDYQQEENIEKKIEEMIFFDCKKLRKIIFPENQEHIYIGRDVLLYCGPLEAMEFPASTKKVTLEHNPCADNFRRGAGTLIFKGKDTELVGCLYEGGEDYNFITASKIVAPKNSKAIEFAKKAKKISYMADWIKDDIKRRDPQYNYSEGFESSIKLALIEWEEI